MAQQHSIVTIEGRNLEAAKTAINEAINFTHIALGDGDRIPAGGETELENEIYRDQITGTGVDPAQPNTAWFELYVPAAVDTLHIREIGLFAEDGTLYALSRFSELVPKFGPDSTSLSDDKFRILVTFADVENIVVQVSPVGAVTGDTLPQFLPFATTVEANNVETRDKIIQIDDLHDILNGLVPDFPFATQAQFDNSIADKISQIAQVKSYIATELANALAANTANQIGNLLMTAGPTPMTGEVVLLFRTGLRLS